MSTGKVQARVDRGVTVLDEKFPGWHMDVDVWKLDLDSNYDCVLAQIARNRGVIGYGTTPFERALSVAHRNPRTPWSGVVWCIRRGFFTRERDKRATELAWARVIEQRKALARKEAEARAFEQLEKDRQRYMRQLFDKKTTSNTRHVSVIREYVNH